MIISVIGGEDATGDALSLADEIGRELGKRGITLCCGGRGGIMEAACRGARSAGGHTIGILPGHDASESPPNRWVEFPVFTGIGYARNSAVVLSGDAVIAIDGAYGTLSEIAYALIHDTPVIGLDTWDFDYHGHEGDRITRVSDPVQAAELAIEKAKSRRQTSRGSHAEQ
jgi:uncharacterized protein (TIGR00725 family)